MVQNLAAQELVSEPTEQKQRWSIYTMLLLISLIALTLAIVLLVVELDKYGPTFKWWTTTIAAPQAASLETTLYQMFG